MEWNEFEQVKNRIPAHWELNEKTNCLYGNYGQILVSHEDKGMFRALVADAVDLYGVIYD